VFEAKKRRRLRWCYFILILILILGLCKHCYGVLLSFFGSHITDFHANRPIILPFFVFFFKYIYISPYFWFSKQETFAFGIPYVMYIFVDRFAMV